MSMYIINRTLNPSGKSIPNTERFLIRAKKQIQEYVAKMINNGSIVDAATGTGNSITVSGSKIHEPSFWIDKRNSDWKGIYPGNPDTEDFLYFNPPHFHQNSFMELMKYVEGDEIPKPPGAAGGGSGGSADGEGRDEFMFSLSAEDWERFLFNHLSLPNKDETKKKLTTVTWEKAGFTSSGSPANLSLIRTMRNSFGRRIGLNRPKNEEIDDLEKQIKEETDPELLNELNVKLNALKNKMVAIPWIDPIDVRYATHVKRLTPKFNAVMFCLMDTSASMTEDMKALAKRFYVFLYKFLKSKYQNVEIVFIRHTTIAQECGEEQFFYDPETGGTVVSSALDEMLKIIAARYPLNDWNIYGAQVSDGDNYLGDNPKCFSLIQDILPISQYYVYIEVSRSQPFSFNGISTKETDLWNNYKNLLPKWKEKFVMEKLNHKDQIWPLMVKIFGDS